jgi:pilus assembly protein Flp/PilA
MFRNKRRASEKGQGLVEYALLLVLVAVVVIVILSLVGRTIADKMCDVVIELSGQPIPDDVAACRAPRITLQGIAGGQTVSGTINVEAVIKNNNGLMKTGATVDFMIDGVTVNHEGGWRYCLAGGADNGPACNNYNLSGLPSGTHTLKVVATDSDSGLTGETTTTFVVP